LFIRTTESVCPSCLTVIPAQVEQQDGAAYMVKTCPSCGSFRVRVARHAWYYRGLFDFYGLVSSFARSRRSLPFERFMIYPTSRCNAACPICYASETAVSEPTLDEIRRMVQTIGKPGRKVSLLGGEPTMRDDLPEIVRLVRRAGHQPVMVSNGLRLADRSLVRRLREAGLTYLWLSLDSIRDDEVYRQIRGAPQLEVKLEALSNLRQENVRTGLIVTVVRGVNEDEIAPVLQYAAANAHIEAVGVRSFVPLGRGRGVDAEELSMDELAELATQASGGQLTLEEFYLTQKLIYALQAGVLRRPVCYVKQNAPLPRIGSRPMRDLLPARALKAMLDRFERRWPRSPTRARALLLLDLGRIAVRHPWISTQLGLGALTRILWGAERASDSRYFRLGVAKFYSPRDYDREVATCRCNDAWLPSFAAGETLDYCGFIISQSPSTASSGQCTPL